MCCIITIQLERVHPDAGYYFTAAHKKVEYFKKYTSRQILFLSVKSHKFFGKVDKFINTSDAGSKIFTFSGKIFRLRLPEGMKNMTKVLKYEEISQDLMEKIPALLERGGDFYTEKELQQMYGASRETVRRALRALEEKGYIKARRGSGRILTGLLPEEGRNQVVILLPSDSYYLYPSLIADISDVLGKAGYPVTIFSSEGSLKKERSILSYLLQDPPRGMICLLCQNGLAEPNTDLLTALASAGTSLLFLDGTGPELSAFPSVKGADFEGGKQLCEYFLACGHRQIGAIFRSDTLSGRQRYSGFISALREKDLLPAPEDILWYDISGIRRMEKDQDDYFLKRFLMKRSEALTGIICQDDMIAFQLLSACRSLKIRVPEDLSIAGFDGSYLCRMGNVRLSSMRHEKHEAGRAAASLLMKQMAGKSISSITLGWAFEQGGSIKIF